MKQTQVKHVIVSVSWEDKLIGRRFKVNCTTKFLEDGIMIVDDYQTKEFPFMTEAFDAAKERMISILQNGGIST